MKASGPIVIAGYAQGLGESLRTRFETGGYAVVCVSRRGDPRWATDLSDPQRHAVSPPAVPADLRSDHARGWATMVLTAFNVSQQAIPRLRAQGAGHVVVDGLIRSERTTQRFAQANPAEAVSSFRAGLHLPHWSSSCHIPSWSWVRA